MKITFLGEWEGEWEPLDLIIDIHWSWWSGRQSNQRINPKMGGRGCYYFWVCHISVCSITHVGQRFFIGENLIRLSFLHDLHVALHDRGWNNVTLNVTQADPHHNINLLRYLPVTCWIGINTFCFLLLWSVEVSCTMKIMKFYFWIVFDRDFFARKF